MTPKKLDNPALSETFAAWVTARKVEIHLEIAASKALMTYGLDSPEHIKAEAALLPAKHECAKLERMHDKLEKEENED